MNVVSLVHASTEGTVGTSATTNAILVIFVIILFMAVAFVTTKRKSLGDLFADLKK